ncbi:uncharacterized protein LOC122512903 isoform X1 [Leptopilina heterotoma]|uniref:uncharacterized protein LOC122512903 isoform X1 n=1 Tax=Leptopilina heterotoma TaxID=63436 RepID=UPI001CA9F7FC|nr:uncharacterized protein LOC122512903 isoform X1 [Leptopilina heterotoma]XP_043484975.1 uncharacterized protein LOC122512903 isoform X1 [Leptopilina heterotoma]XP_043484976.1 uncharacterized protein LOC122512903 isoform X1 [Leptopilina heterotoma]XP_043484977.1 uncharacterized protein LOC122512903 isoform X1 [Leptopilina heterotoma]XP_043484978.1 uncharacterized protein LOC122512903 isoform X1 [Leptopilina heterotoma]XP_043484981.1 uncharacterized protein LOC122512903 isoform X1 [Leptopilina
MNKITILGIIITIIFVVKLVSTEISPSERINEYETLKALRQKVIKEYLTNYDLATAYETLSHYILNESEMYAFAEHLNRTGNIPEWSIKRQLKNPTFFEILRYAPFLGKLTDYVHTRRYNIDLYSNRLNYFLKFPINKLLKSYMKKDIKDIIVFEDFVAIIVFLQDESQINFNNPAAWSMIRALYSLAIRQYSSNSILNYKPEKCFFKRKETKSYGDNIKINDIFKKVTFSICKSNYTESYSYYSLLKNNSLSYLMTYETIITDPLVRVSLEDILENRDGKVDVLLPKVELSVISSPKIKKSIRESTVFVTLACSPIYERSNWLTAMANEIEKYKQKEREYFHNLNLKN